MALTITTNQVVYNSRNLSLSISGSQKSQIKVSAELEAAGEDWPLVTSGGFLGSLGLWLYHSNLYLCLQVAFL